MIHYLGYFAGMLTVASFLPQVIRTWKTRRTADLRLGMIALLVTASTLWIIYGIIIKDWPVILTNTGMVLLTGSARCDVIMDWNAKADAIGIEKQLDAATKTVLLNYGAAFESTVPSE